MLVQNQAPEGKGSAIATKPQPTPYTLQPNILATQTAQLQAATHPTVSYEPQSETHIEQILPSPSTYQRKHRKTHKPRKTKKVPELPQNTVPLDIGADEAVHQEGGDSVERAITTEIGSGDRPRHQETTLKGADAQTRFKTASKRSSDPPLSTGHTVRSGEDMMEQETDLTDFVPPTPHDSPLSGGHTPGSDEGRPNINELKRSKGQRTPGMKLFKIGTFKKKTFDKEHVSKQGKDESNRTEEVNLSDKGSGKTKVFDYTTAVEKDVNAAKTVTAGDAVNAVSVIPDVSAAGPSTSTDEDIFKDEMTTMTDILMSIRRTRPRVTSVVIHDVEKEPRRGTPPPTVLSQDKDCLKKNKHSLREQMIAREKAVEQEAKDAVLIEQMEDVQARIDADALLAERLQQEEREQFTVDEQAKMLVDLIAERKRFFAAQRAEQIRNKPPTKAQLRNKMILRKLMTMNNKQKVVRRDQEYIMIKSVKKQKLEEDDSEKKKLRACLDIVPVDDIAVDVESLATKYLIVDWKRHTLTEHMMYYQIIRANGSFNNYKILTEMCDDFDRQDIMDIYRLVKERYETASLEGYGLLL
nr:hypothetical protein [Tanacetum cinerariifolium]